MTLICPVFNLIPIFQIFLQKQQPFETLISSLIQDKSVSFPAILVFTCILFFILYMTCTG